MSVYLGDYPEDAGVTFYWNTVDGLGASITRATDGTVKVIRDDGTDCTGTSVTDTEDSPDVGIHKCVVDTSDNANFAVGYDYAVWVDGAVVDGQTINAVIAHFSIENRFQEVDLVKIGGVAVSTTTAQVGVNVVQVSGDSTAADNLESQYDGTGITGGNYPSTQSQVTSLSSGSAAISTTAESFTKAGAEGETNTYTATATLNGTLHSITPDAGTTDVYYQFDVGSEGVAVEVVWNGYCNTAGDSVAIQAYNWVTTNWDQIGSRTGTPATTVVEGTYQLTTAHTGTGANQGKVRIKFYSTTTTNISTDRLLTSYAVVRQTVGYADGAIWIDTNASNTNTEDYVDGTADNPVSTLAAAETLSASLGIVRFRVKNGSSITLASDSTNYTLIGDGLWTLALGGQTIANAYVRNADVSGIGSGSGTIFEDCRIEASTSTGPSYFVRCGFNTPTGTPFTSNGNGEYVFVDCVSLVAGSGTPYFDFTGEGAATGINNRRWAGGAHYTLDSDCTCSHEVLAGGGQTFVTDGADVEIRGVFRSLTLTLTGAGTVQSVGVMGPITISGTATTTVNLYGYAYDISDSSSGTTVNNYTIDDVNVAQIGGSASAATAVNQAFLGTGDVGDVDFVVRSIKANNDAGVGLDINGTTAGATVTASAGPGLDIDGTTFGVDIDASAGPGVAVDGTTIGIDVNASVGPGIDVDGVTGGIDVTASIGPALDLDGASAGVTLDSSGGAGFEITGATNGLTIVGSVGEGIDITGGSDGVEINGVTGVDINGSGSGVAITGSAAFGLIISGVTKGIYATASNGDGVDIVGVGGAGLGLTGTTFDLEATTTDSLQTDAVKISGDSTAADNLELAFDGTGYAFTGCTMPWNSSWDAEVQSEVNDALVALNLDHLMATAVADNDDMSTEVADGTVLSNLMSSTSDTSTFVVSTDSLQGIADSTASANSSIGTTGTELTGTPGDAPDIATMVQFMYMRLRNKKTMTSTLTTISNTAGTVISQATISYVAGTTTVAEFEDP